MKCQGNCTAIFYVLLFFVSISTLADLIFEVKFFLLCYISNPTSMLVFSDWQEAQRMPSRDNRAWKKDGYVDSE